MLAKRDGRRRPRAARSICLRAFDEARPWRVGASQWTGCCGVWVLNLWRAGHAGAIMELRPDAVLRAISVTGVVVNAVPNGA